MMSAAPTNSGTARRSVRLTVAGSFGFGNAGDDGAPLAVQDVCASMGIDAHVDVLARFDEPASTSVIGLGAVDAPRRIAIADQPALLVGGGIIEPAPKAALTRLGGFIRHFGVPYAALFGASVEPGRHYGWGARRRLMRDLKNMRHLFVRDTLSAATLREIVPGRVIDAIGDVVLWMRAAEEVPPALQGVDRYVAVNLAPRWSNDAGWRPWIAAQLAAVAKRLDSALVFVSCTQQHDSDHAEHEAVAQLLRDAGFDGHLIVLEPQPDPRVTAATFGQATLVIAMRLHACVMAFAQQVPWVGLAYHPKLSGFAETVQQAAQLLPQRLPALQSADRYGYTFSQLNLADCDLVRAGERALEEASFHLLAPLRQRLADAMRTVLEEAITPHIVAVAGETH